MLLVLEAALEVSPLFLLFLGATLLGWKYFFSFITVVVIWVVTLYASSAARLKIIGVKRAVSKWGQSWRGGLLEVMFWASYQEFRIYQVFMANFCFKTGSISIIFEIFNAKYLALYCCTAMAIIFLVAYKSHVGTSKTEKWMSALYYTFTNAVNASRCPLVHTGRNVSQMMAVTATWVILNTTVMIVGMIWVGIPSYHLGKFSSHNFEYINVIHKCIILLLGPISILVTKRKENETPDAEAFDAMSDFDKFKFTLMVDGPRYPFPPHIQASLSS